MNNKRAKAGQTFSAIEKLYSETVVLIPSFAEQKNELKVYIDELNSLGYDVFSFDLPDRQLSKIGLPSASSELRFGLRHHWVDQIEGLLNLLPGKKHIFSFSYSGAAIPKVLENRAAYDISSWISDSGPFGKMPQNFWSLQKSLAAENSPSVARLKQFLHPVLLDAINYRSDLKSSLGHLPKGFPILNIRGWRDKICHFTDLDFLFNSNHQLGFETLSLPDAGHLEGALKAPKDYFTRVKSFLKKISHPV